MVARMRTEVLAIAAKEMLQRDETARPGDIRQRLLAGMQQLPRLLKPQVQVVSGWRTTQATFEQPLEMATGNAHGLGELVDAQRWTQMLVHQRQCCLKLLRDVLHGQ